MFNRLWNRLRGRWRRPGGSLHQELLFGRVDGWAWDPDRPTTSPTVLVEVDGVQVGQTLASRYRHDVFKRGYSGHGRVGFRFQIPERFYDGRPHEVRARVLANGFELHRSPLSITLGATLTASTELCGNLPPLRGTRVRGWVLWGGARRRSLDLEVFEDGRKLMDVRANRERPDIAKALQGAHRCGYEFALPEDYLRAGSRQLSIRVAGTALEVPGSPVDISADVLRDEMSASLDRNLARVEQIMARLQATGAWHPDHEERARPG